MEILLGILIAVGILSLIIAMRPVTTFIHEMGHAIPALLFTKDDVKVYIGSYGDISNSWKWQSGRFQLFFSLNLFQLNMGLCQYNGQMAIRPLLITILGGPTASLIMGLLLLFSIISFQPSDGVIFILSLFITSFVWDFLVNIIPQSTPVSLHDGSIIYNDGAQLRRVWLLSRDLEEYNLAMNNISQGNIEKATGILKGLVIKRHYQRLLVDELVDLLVKEGQYQDALNILDEYKVQKSLKEYHYKSLGKIFLGLERYEDALSAFNQHWYFKFGDYETLNGKATALLGLGRTEEAADETEASLQINSTNNIIAFVNRTRISIRAGNIKHLEEDLEKLEGLIPESDLFHFLKAQYYELVNKPLEALAQYEEAKALGSTHHGIDLKIESLKRKQNS